SNATIRPRMHFVDTERLLLETGSSDGLGLWVELAKAEPLAEPADADPESKLAKRLYAITHDSIPLPGSAERRPQNFDPESDLPWDGERRSYASVVNGLRVTIERPMRAPTRLLVDPLDGDRHFVIGNAPGIVRRGVLDQTG